MKKISFNAWVYISMISLAGLNIGTTFIPLGTHHLDWLSFMMAGYCISFCVQHYLYERRIYWKDKIIKLDENQINYLTNYINSMTIKVTELKEEIKKLKNDAL